MTRKLRAVLAVAVLTAATLPGQATAETLPKSARAYLAAGESLADAHYNLMFGQRKTGTDSLEGTGLTNRWGRSLRLFDGPFAGRPTEPHTQKQGMYDIAYKGAAGEQVTGHLPNGMTHAASNLHDFTFFDGTALWLGHSRFSPGAAPPVGQDSPPATGTRADGTTGPADADAAVRADDAHLISIPVVPNTETKRSFLISAHVMAPKHPDVAYGLRPQPYLDRGGWGLTVPGGAGNRIVDLGSVTDRFATLQVRADVVTHGGTKADTSDDTGKVTYRYFLDNVEVGTADTIDMLASALRTGQGDVRFGPSFALTRGWQRDAPEVFIDNIAVYDIQNIPFRTSWLGETLLPQDAAKYHVSRHPNYERHVPNYVRGIWVDPQPTADGRALVFANADWDEGGLAQGIYSYEVVDGKGVIRPYGRLGTHGRNHGGRAVTGDATSIYASHQAGATSCVGRYDRSRIAPDFGVPPAAEFCIPDLPSSEDYAYNVHGLAAGAQHLFVALKQHNELRVYRKDQLTTPVGILSITNPGAMTYSAGRLWVIVNGQRVQEYVVNDTTGALTVGRQLTGLVPSAVALDRNGLLHVTNDARFTHQIHVYDTTKPGLPEVGAKRLGELGGVTELGGAYGPSRFDGLTGVGVDSAGNYYVAGNGVGASAAKSPLFFDLRRFNGATKALEAEAHNYFSTSTVAHDPASPSTVYSASHRLDLNLDAQVPGTEWAPNRTTLMSDRYRCPDDARVNGIHQNAAIAVRQLGQKKYLFVTGQGVVNLMGVYRLTDDKRSVPSMFFNDFANNGAWPANKPTSNLWSWRDTDGDCQFDASEYDTPTHARALAWSVAEQGDLWMSGYDAGSNHVLSRIRFTGNFDGPAGSPNPIYDLKNIEVMPLPQPFARAEGLVYQSATDTLYLLGRSNTDPKMRTGWQLARYDRFHARHLAGQAQTPTWLNQLRSDVAEFCPDDPNVNCRPYTLTAAGDRVYVSTSAPLTPLLAGQIRMYDAATGARKGSLVPGPEVAHRSGWHDMKHAVTAMQLPDGRRFVFAEENFYGRPLLYKGF